MTYVTLEESGLEHWPLEQWRDVIKKPLVYESDYLAERKAREAAEALVRRYEETRPRSHRGN